MTTIYKKEQYTTTHDVFVSCTCDKCGKALPVDYGNQSYNYREFTLEFETGEHYPDGGNTIGWRINDLCDTCVAQLKEMLLSLGFTIEDYERDY